MKDIPFDSVISDRGVLLGNTRYIIDGLFLSNAVRGHAVSGITCNNVRYVYNGWTTRIREKTLPLFKFDWINEKGKALEVKTPGYFVDNGEFRVSNTDRPHYYGLRGGKWNYHTYLFVNEKYTRRPLTPVVQLPPTPSPFRPPPTPPFRPVPPPPRPPIRPHPSRPNQQRSCPPGKIINPRTDRCVNIDGKIGRQILMNRPPQPNRPQSPQPPKPKSTVRPNR